MGPAARLHDHRLDPLSMQQFAEQQTGRTGPDGHLGSLTDHDTGTLWNFAPGRIGAQVAAMRNTEGGY